MVHSSGIDYRADRGQHGQLHRVARTPEIGPVRHSRLRGQQTLQSIKSGRRQMTAAAQQPDFVPEHSGSAFDFHGRPPSASRTLLRPPNPMAIERKRRPVTGRAARPSRPAASGITASAAAR
ncbi:hypothetical protein SDC9_180622 [bioreactor metagenome]|uniref:Uncharacterized protein n=1 Tax=bioreactor metagenome TaxID=1076179 RepID=A0A645H520_9ZZZZ